MALSHIPPLRTNAGTPAPNTAWLSPKLGWRHTNMPTLKGEEAYECTSRLRWGAGGHAASRGVLSLHPRWDLARQRVPHSREHAMQRTRTRTPPHCRHSAVVRWAAIATEPHLCPRSLPYFPHRRRSAALPLSGLLVAQGASPRRSPASPMSCPTTVVVLEVHLPRPPTNRPSSVREISVRRCSSSRPRRPPCQSRSQYVHHFCDGFKTLSGRSG